MHAKIQNALIYFAINESGLFLLNSNTNSGKRRNQTMNRTPDQLIDRIAHLEEENQALKRLLKTHNKPDKSDRSFAQIIIDSLPNPLFIKDEKHRYVLVNAAFETMMNANHSELIGKSDYDFLSDEQSEIFWRVDDEVLENGKTNWNEEDLTSKGKKHKLITSKVRIEHDNGQKYVLGLITDITENKNNQALLQKQNKEIEAQKENIQTLLQEVHHRVKNNMQIISSLLNLQMDQFEDTAVLEAFNNCRNRILSMANVHEILYRTKNFAEVNVNIYTKSLIENLKVSYNLNDEIKFKVDMLNLFISADRAISLGLIINEVITNSVKHACSDQKGIDIYVRLEKSDSLYMLKIGDNGPGVDSFPPENKGLGLDIIDVLTKQLEAVYAVSTDGPGLHYTFTFRKDQLQNL